MVTGGRSELRELWQVDEVPEVKKPPSPCARAPSAPRLGPARPRTLTAWFLQPLVAWLVGWFRQWGKFFFLESHVFVCMGMFDEGASKRVVEDIALCYCMLVLWDHTHIHCYNTACKTSAFSGVDGGWLGHRDFEVQRSSLSSWQHSQWVQRLGAGVLVKGSLSFLFFEISKADRFGSATDEASD